MSELIDFLRTITVNPTLLPSAADVAGDDPAGERARENHPCVRCGKPASAARITGTDAGPRWLDFCPSCEDDYASHDLMLEAMMDTNEYGIGPIDAVEPTIFAGVHEPGLANARRKVEEEHPGFRVFRRTNGGAWVPDSERS